MIDKEHPLRRLTTAALGLATIAAIYGLLRESPPPQLFPQSDKFVHLSVFAFLAGGLELLFPKVSLRRVLVIGLLAIAVGTELLQATPWLPQRTFSLWDLAANLVGTGLGIVATRGLIRAYARLPAKPNFGQQISIRFAGFARKKTYRQTQVSPAEQMP